MTNSAPDSGPLLQRRAKIVATIGPASAAPDRLRKLIEAGIDIARLNFSHGTHQDHAQVIKHIRSISQELDRPVALLQDLQGPKIRIGDLPGGGIDLKIDDPFMLTTEAISGDQSRASITYLALPNDVDEGDTFLLSDGLLRFQVESIDHSEVHCRVLNDGHLRSRVGVNLPGIELSMPALTDKDRVDLEFGIAQQVDFIALSFVRRAADIVELKDLLAAANADIPVIAKLEKPEAVEENLDAILAATDAVMVARGDLGVELEPERVPFLQKTIIQQAAHFKKPVITATQMLESMVDNPRPTRAEVSDVANAVFDGTDAVMLSAETASGKYPIESVRMMDKIIRDAESHIPDRHERRADEELPIDFSNATAQAACRAAADIEAKAIVACTQSGFTALLISNQRPSTPILAFTPHTRIYHRLCLYWGIVPKLLLNFVPDNEKMIAKIDTILAREHFVRPDDSLVIISGTPVTHQGATNLMKLHRVGETSA